MQRWSPSARPRPSCPSCCRWVGRRTPARSGTGRCGSARRSCRSTPPGPRSNPRRRRAGPRPPPGAGRTPAARGPRPVVVGLDGGYVRSRHRPERHFEVIAGKVIDAQGAQHRFAFARNGQATASEAFGQALAAAGVRADTPATVLCDGDAGLWRLQREALPGATIVLDWWHAAVRFEHALQAARGLGTDTADASLAHDAARTLDRAKWCLWHGRWTGCRRKLAALCRWTKR